MKKVHGKPTEIQLNEKLGGTLRVYASSVSADKPTGVAMEFVVEDKDFTAILIADTPAKMDRIIKALVTVRQQVWGE